MRNKLCLIAILMLMIQYGSTNIGFNNDNIDMETGTDSINPSRQPLQQTCTNPFSNRMMMEVRDLGRHLKSCQLTMENRRTDWMKKDPNRSKLQKNRTKSHASHPFLLNQETIRDNFNLLYRYYLPTPAYLTDLNIKEQFSETDEIVSYSDLFLQRKELDQDWIPSSQISKENQKISIEEQGNIDMYMSESSPSGSPGYIPLPMNADTNDMNGRSNWRLVHEENVDTDTSGLNGKINLHPKPNITAQCVSDVKTMIAAFNFAEINNGTEQYEYFDNLWHYKMMDSWGKAGDGILVGNTNYMGIFKECMETNSGILWPKQSISGQYCIVIPIPYADNPSTQLPTSYSTCMPSSCTEDDLTSSLKYHLAEILYYPIYISCIQQDEGITFGTWEIIGCSIIGFLILLVLISAVVDLVMKEKCPLFFKAFSAAENMSKIMAVRMDVPGEISCIYGIRVLSICWVMLGHQYSFIVGSGMNGADVLKITQAWMFQVIWTGYKSVDTFFTIGGLLVAKSLFKESFCFDKPTRFTSMPGVLPQESKATESTLNLVKTHRSSNNSLNNDEDHNNETIQPEDGTFKPSTKSETRNPLHPLEVIDETVFETHDNSFYDAHLWNRLQQQGLLRTSVIFLRKYTLYLSNRIIRMWPTMFIVMLFCAGPSSFFVWGPGKGIYGFYLDTCRTNWWTDLTFFTNFILKSFKAKAKEDPEYDRPTDSCIFHNWYVTVDFQLQLVLPFLILPCKILKQKAVYLSFLLLVACIIPGLIAVVNDIMPALLMTLDDTETTRHFQEIYVMPYARASPYFVGALCALLLIKAEEANKKGVIPLWQVMLSKKSVQVVGWAVFFITCQAVVFGLTGANYYSYGLLPENRPRELTGFENFIYGSFAVAAWAMCICWIIVMCVLNMAGPVNRFLSHPMWQPLSRVSYSVYLISLPIQRLVFSNVFRHIYLTNLSIIMSFCGIAVFSFLSAFVISLIAESPFIALNRIARGRS